VSGGGKTGERKVDAVMEVGLKRTASQGDKESVQGYGYDYPNGRHGRLGLEIEKNRFIGKGKVKAKELSDR